MDNSFRPRDRIQELLDYIQYFKYQDSFLRIGHHPHPNMTPFDKIYYGSQALMGGALPDAETLEYIALSLNKYIRKKGEISLDEAFGLKSKPKAGNPSRQFANEIDINNMLFDMACIRRDNPNISIEEAALQVCEKQNNHDKSATLCREYSRGKWKNIESLIPKIESSK